MFGSKVEGELDRILINIIDKLQNRKTNKSIYSAITIDEKSIMAAHIAIQYQRTKFIRDNLCSLIKSYAEQAYSISGKNISNVNHEEQARIIHLEDIINMDSINFIANVFNDKKWVFLENQTTHSFYTSDTPVICFNLSKTNKLIHPFLSQEMIFFFPLSPKYAVVLYPTEFKTKDLSICEIKDIYNVAVYNMGQIHLSRRSIYSIENDFKNYMK